MTCPHCGAANAEGATACTGCGATLAASPMGFPAPPQPPPGYAPYGTTPPPPRKQSTGAGAIIALVAAVGCLLVVLIGGIMAAILFPAFAKARSKAQQTSCLSNVRQIQTGLLSYAQDHDEALPFATNWCDALQPYTRNPQIFRCPSLPNSPGGDYWLNRPVAGVRVTRFLSPSDAGCLFEGSTSRWNAVGGAGDVAARHPTSGGGSWANYGFADGHAKSMEPGREGSGFWSPALGPEIGGPVVPPAMRHDRTPPMPPTEPGEARIRVPSRTPPMPPTAPGEERMPRPEGDSWR